MAEQRFQLFPISELDEMKVDDNQKNSLHNHAFYQEQPLMKFLRRLSLLPLALILLTCGCSRENMDAPPRENASNESSGVGTKISRNSIVKHRKVNAAKQTAGFLNPHAKPAVMDKALTGPVVLIKGYVRFADGQPATSASLELYSLSNDSAYISKMDLLTTATPDEQGRYQVKTPDAGSLYLKVTGGVPDKLEIIPGGSSARETTQSATRIIVKNFTIPIPQQMHGLVIDQADKPIPGVTVYTRQYEPTTDYYNSLSLTRTTTSSAEGTFVFDNLAPGNWFVGALVAGFKPELIMQELPATEPVVLRFASQGGTVTGKVLLHPDGTPVEGMKVLLDSPARYISEVCRREQISGKDGSFRFENTSTGSLDLYVPTNEAYGLGEVPPYKEYFKLGDGETTDIPMLVYHGHTLSGTVFDEGTSEPLAGVTLSAGDGRYFFNEKNRKQTVRSVADGTFRISAIFVRQGGITLEVASDGYRVPGQFASPDSVTIEAPMDKLELYREIPMEKLFAVSGHVTTTNGMPIDNAQLRFVGRKHGGHAIKPGRSKPDGAYQVDVIPFDEGYVYAEANGYSSARSEKVRTAPVPLENVDIAMAPASTIRGIVVLPDGNAAAGAKVINDRPVTFDEPGYYVTAPETITDDLGQFVMQNLPQKPVLIASKEGFANSKPMTIDLQPGEEQTNVTIHLQEPLSISGRVVNKEGLPVKINLLFNGQSTAQVKSGSDGTFNSTGLAEGRYKILGGTGGFMDVLKPDVPAGAKDLELVYDDTPKHVSLIGTVVDDVTGKAIEEFFIKGTTINRTDVPGEFQLDKIPINASLTLTISSKQYQEQPFRVITPNKPGPMKKEFRLGLGGIVTGGVTNGKSGKPEVGATVMGWVDTPVWMRKDTEPRVHAITDDQGRFTLVPVPGGDHVITIRPASGMEEKSVNVHVTSEQTTDMGEIKLLP